ncbi:MAG: isochorismatase family protein, partial [Phycisphaeraceae bacterium]
MAVPRLDAERTAVLIVDVQEKLLPVIDGADQLVAQVGKLLDGADALELPVLVTEQYPKGLGATTPVLAERMTRVSCKPEKVKFSSFVEPVRDELARLGARSVVVAGIEAHVCVLQTCLDLLDGGYTAAVAVDAIASRRPMEKDAAVQRMVQAGVVPTTVESMLLEIVREAGSERFKA